MAKSAYPDGRDVQNYLEAAGLTVSDDLSDLLDTAAESGRLDFERASGRKFIGDTAATTYYFDPPADTQGLLSLAPCRDMYSVSSVIYYPTNGTSTTLTLNTDYWLEPFNALAEERPYEYVQFREGRWQCPLSPILRRSIQISGKAGWAATCPDDAWEAMVYRAMWQAAGALLGSSRAVDSSGRFVKSWSGAGVSQSYDTDGFSELREAWGGKDGLGGIVGRALNTYRRMSI